MKHYRVDMILVTFAQAINRSNTRKGVIAFRTKFNKGYNRVAELQLNIG